jgi:MoaA/NifB/PqqE/SkfB family radical SAM enzyme
MKKNIILNNPDFLRGSLNILTSELIINVFEAIQNNELNKIYPLSVHFEITNRCNSRCNHCERWKWKNQKELDTHNILNIIDILTFLKVKTLTIGGGEPFLYTGLNSVLEKCKKNKIRIGVTSNGLLLNKNNSKILINNCDWIRLSLDAFDKETYKKVRGIPNFEKVVFNINNLLKYRKTANHLKIAINFVIQKNNYFTIPMLEDFLKKCFVDFISFKLPHGNGNFLLSLNELYDLLSILKQIVRRKVIKSRTNLVQLYNTLNNELDLRDIELGYPTKTYYNRRRYLCFVPFFFITIDPLGYCYPCDYLYYDTRSEAEYIIDRKKYEIGNILNLNDLFEKRQLFINNMDNINTNKIYECGCCTRFYRFNSIMNMLYNEYLSYKCNDDLDSFRNIVNHLMNKVKIGWL